MSYAEEGVRYVMFACPPEYDRWGFNEAGEKWLHSFCVIDDFGNAVPVEDVWPTYSEGYQQFLAPEFGDHGPYVLQYPTIH